MRFLCTLLAAFLLLVLISIGGCKLERYVHYKLSYQYMVAEQMQPLADKITTLEKRVEQLEKNK